MGNAIRSFPKVQYVATYKLLPSLIAIVVTVLVSCGPEQGDSQQTSFEEDAPPADGSGEATQTEEEPAGEVIEIGGAPEGIVADPETGLVAVGLRDPDRLVLVDGSSGDVVRDVELPESPRHLSLTAPGGSVLVPAEDSDALVQVSLPEGEVLDEIPVGTSPHDAAATPNGRIFVGNEYGDTVSVVEDGSETDRIENLSQPGGVATTNDGLVGVVSVEESTLEVFDADYLDSLGRVGAGEGPTHIVAGPENRFYITDTSGDAILVYDALPQPEQVDNVALPGSPYGIAIDPERGFLWTTTEDRLVQYALEGGMLREIARYPTVREPYTVAVDTASGRVFVAGRAEGELQILDPNEA